MTTNPIGPTAPIDQQTIATIQGIALEMEVTVSALRLAEGRVADAHLLAKNALDRAKSQHEDLVILLSALKNDPHPHAIRTPFAQSSAQQ